jgi:hypothetical protein
MKKTIALLTVLLVSLSLVSLSWADKGKKEVKPQLPEVQKQPAVILPVAEQPSAPAAFQIPWSSINGGGDVSMSSANYKAKVTTGQSVIGESQSTNFQMGIGFWYGASSACLAKPGDANASGTYTLGDVISIVNYIFSKPGCTPVPLCWVSNLLCRGDWNGSGTVTLGDAIQGVNYIFTKPGGPWNAVLSGVCCL